jgi:hypothetical protein
MSDIQVSTTNQLQSIIIIITSHPGIQRTIHPNRPEAATTTRNPIRRRRRVHSL